MAALLAEDRRLVALRSLSEATGYSLNEAILKRLLEHVGHTAGRDLVRGDLTYLEEHALVRIEHLQMPSGELWVAHLLPLGDEVARGRQHPGIARLPPG